jgi:ABC-type polar amino acid transport system ATPase subunit
MIVVRDLVKEWVVKPRRLVRVLDGVCVTVRPGEVAAVIGPSGGGKSTLLRCINGLETFEQGDVQVDDLHLKPGVRRHESREVLGRLRRRVGMVFQQFHLFPHMNVLDNVLSGPLYVLRQRRPDAEPEARRLLERVGLGDKLWARPEELSGGQQQRVAIARALAVKPEFMLFDEPTSALDPGMAGEVFQVITDLARSGQTMMVVTHAMTFARDVAHTVHVMQGGRIVESGPPAQIFADPQREATRDFLAKVKGQ